MPNLRPDGTRPADILISNYAGSFRDVIIDVTVAGVVAPARSASHAQYITTPGAAARQAEALKFRQDLNSSRPLRSVHRFIPLFAVEEFGRLGDHAEAFLFEMATAATNNRTHLQYLPADSPQAKFFLQQKLKNWRQRVSLATNCIHAAVLQQRACRNPRLGHRQPPPHNLLTVTPEDCQQLIAFPDVELLEAADYDLE